MLTTEPSAPLTFDLPEALIEKIARAQIGHDLASASEVVRFALATFDPATFQPAREPHRQISVRITVKQRAALRQTAKGKDVSVADVIRAALEQLPEKSAVAGTMARQPVRANRRRTGRATRRHKRMTSVEKAALLDDMRRYFTKHVLPQGGGSTYLLFRAGKLKHTAGVCPAKFPFHPHKYFRGHGWKGYEDLLGLPLLRHRPSTIMPFAKAREFARSLELKTAEEFQEWRMGRIPGKPAKPRDFPSNPQVVYHGKGWKGYEDFLGYTAIRGPYAPARRQALLMRQGKE